MATVRESNSIQFLPLVLAGLGIVIFLGGLIVGSRSFASRTTFGAHEAVISRIESPLENPRGYAAAASALALCGALMLPAVRTVFMGLRQTSAVLSGFGSALLALGFLAEIGLGCLARLWSMYGKAHIILAFAAFLALASGLGICLALAAWLRRNHGLFLLAAIQLLAVSVLVYMLFNPDFPPERSFLTSLAFFEWLLCVSFIVSVLALVASVTFPPPGEAALNSAVARDH
jgi:hypothetical protein